jgi:hypothetical protein
MSISVVFTFCLCILLLNSLDCKGNIRRAPVIFKPKVSVVKIEEHCHNISRIGVSDPIVLP